MPPTGGKCNKRRRGFLALRSEIFGEDAPVNVADEVNAHLTTEQTASYVDKQLTGESLQLIADHLTDCELCSLAVEDLQAFRNQVAPSLDLEYQPAAVASSTEGWWHRTLNKLPAFFRVSPLPAWGAALAVLLLIVKLVGWFGELKPKEFHSRRLLLRRLLRRNPPCRRSLHPRLHNPRWQLSLPN